MTANLLIPEEKTWPPHFTLRRSQRAKYMRIRITPQAGLEVVVPHIPRKPEIIHNLLLEHKNWIEKMLQKYNMQQGHPPIFKPIEQLHFPTFNQTWRINYLKLAGENVYIRQTGQFQLTCLGAIENVHLKKTALRTWLNHRGKQLLLPHLQQISQQLQLPYFQGQIRYQKTRWGSCSASKVINLNQKLLFLPENLIRYIIIHELCHTIHLNHSRRFWQLVAKFDPHVEHHRREMKNAERWIPLELM